VTIAVVALIATLLGFLLLGRDGRTDDRAASRVGKATKHHALPRHAPAPIPGYLLIGRGPDFASTLTSSAIPG